MVQWIYVYGGGVSEGGMERRTGPNIFCYLPVECVYVEFLGSSSRGTKDKKINENKPNGMTTATAAQQKLAGRQAGRGVI